MSQPAYVLLIDCADQKGLVYKITSVLYSQNVNIIGNQEFVEREQDRFFMRTDFSGKVNDAQILEELRKVLPPDASISLRQKRAKNIVLLVTKEQHCLGELLVRHQFNELNANILAVIGNHDTLKPFTHQFGVNFHLVSHEGKSREQHEQEVLEVVQRYNPEYLVLAKYMRILSPEFVRNFPNRIINIHHSFLPAFIGANPYRQAYERGVKIIGATAHFVNNDLDEGPILMQNVIPVDHTYSVQDMMQSGRDVEKIVLAHALKLVFNDKVAVVGNKTIIFD
ncbi:MAG: formyltetrahydrofolate deformylase [Haliscomenobacter sp.]|uniref:formyltetrahydrofolate deformylase n=1 Tax=Haliscomenobacter sp. TaxID=2717303 RepID=UPI0029ADC734|nr:formyltetrahydrofolate deformylase [Haliscomenobacter sp.]MDX2071025.1 formyltetrahydrofolate deformylase [Haliscomenobacter sp.]